MSDKKTISKDLNGNGYNICITCNTIYQDPITGYCINKHDNWKLMSIEESNYILDRELEKQRENGKSFLSDNEITNIFTKIYLSEGL